MSLVGSLEDLGLGDILQIISLSGKSGVLLLRADRGEGQILFEDGLLRGALAKGGATNLWELLAGKETVPKADLDDAWREAREAERSLGDLLAERGILDADAIDELRRENIETTVFEMFTWHTGEFSFEVRRLADADGDDLFVTPGVNPQFLALEGTRIADEQRHAEGGAAADEFGGSDTEDVDASDADDGPVLGEWVDDADEAAVPAVAADAFAEVEDAEPLLDAEGAEDEPLLTAEPLDDDDTEEAVEAVALSEDEETPSGASEEPEPARAAEVDEGPTEEVEVAAEPVAADAAPAPQGSSAPRALPPVIVVDPSLPVLEWVKGALAGDFPAVHVFQHSDQGIQRIRQYLARAEVPLVILALDAPRDPVSGARDPFEIIARLKRQSARMPVLLLTAPDEQAPRRRQGRPDGVVGKPSATELADTREFEAREAHAARLRERVLAVVSPGDAAPAGPDNAGALARLKEVTARIHAPGARGEVLPEVLRFAAQVFSRVALFMVREDAAVGIAQAGLHKAGGPDEAGLRSVHIGSREPEWFRAVFESGSPITAPPCGEGDQRLGVMLGNDLPLEAYVAPIFTSGQIVALLYGDMLPARQAVGDTEALEVVLHAAGTALDRAVLQRTLDASDPAEDGSSAPPGAG